ncbi:MAG: nitrogen-fixing protein NifU [Bacteroidia bacterium]|nr:MAG: nitrogen-fixing protein NifU [Bacteroidia bacterium]
MNALQRESVEKTLARVRPYLREDGGDVELVRIRDDGIVEVRLTGSCVSCPLSVMTVRAGIERALMLDHEEIRRVEQVK